MAPLDPEQRAEVLEIIKSGVQESHAGTEKALFEIWASTQKGHDDMRVTTEAEITNQRARNLEIETKLAEIQSSIASQFLALRIELGSEFDTSKKEAAENRLTITMFQEQKDGTLPLPDIVGGSYKSAEACALLEKYVDDKDGVEKKQTGVFDLTGTQLPQSMWCDKFAVVSPLGLLNVVAYAMSVSVDEEKFFMKIKNRIKI